MKLKSTALALALTLGTAAFAQTAPSGTATPRLDEREVRQEKRIEQGVQSGQLTQREAQRLKAREERLQRAEARAKADGKVTQQEREHLEHMANKDSRAIAREKHDGQRDMNHDGRKDRPAHGHKEGAKKG